MEYSFHIPYLQKQPWNYILVKSLFDIKSINTIWLVIISSEVLYFAARFSFKIPPCTVG